MTTTERTMLSWIDDATSMLRELRGVQGQAWRERIDELLRRGDGALVMPAGRSRAPMGGVAGCLTDRHHRGGRRSR